MLSDELSAHLAAQGVEREGTLLVHAAFAHLSRQGLAANAFVEALANYMAPGTLAMPTMSWRAVNPQNPLFSARSTPSITGILSEVFRQEFASHRSIHPTHSVAALGAGAEQLTAGPSAANTPCPSDSPFGRVVHNGDWIMLLGVDLTRCTTIHCAEEKRAPDVYLLPVAEHYSCEGLDGRWHQVVTRRHVREERFFERFRAPLRAAGWVAESEFRGVQTICFRADRLNKIVEDALEQDLRATFA